MMDFSGDNIFAHTFTLSQLVVPYLIINGIIFVIALSWNSAIQALVDYYVPKSYKDPDNAWLKMLTTAVLTLVLMFIAIFIARQMNIGLDPITKSIARIK